MALPRPTTTFFSPTLSPIHAHEVSIEAAMAMERHNSEEPLKTPTENVKEEYLVKDPNLQRHSLNLNYAKRK